MEQYERLKILGVGSYGKVYLMRHRQQRRLVCAKIIKIKNIPRKEREACRTEVGICTTDTSYRGKESGDCTAGRAPTTSSMRDRTDRWGVTFA